MTKATEQGLFEAARATLVPYFELVDKTKEKEQEESTNAEGVEASSGGDAAPAAVDKGEEKKPFTVSCVFRPPSLLTPVYAVIMFAGRFVTRTPFLGVHTAYQCSTLTYVL